MGQNYGSQRGLGLVCPDYPFLRNQLGFPAQVGTAFDHENMEQAIQQALNLVKNSQELEFGEHYSIRSVKTISQTLAQKIESNIVGKRKKMIKYFLRGEFVYKPCPSPELEFYLGESCSFRAGLGINIEMKS